MFACVCACACVCANVRYVWKYLCTCVRIFAMCMSVYDLGVLVHVFALGVSVLA